MITYDDIFESNDKFIEFIKEKRKRRLNRFNHYQSLLQEINRYKPRMYYGRKNPHDSIFSTYTTDISYRDITHKNGKLFRRRFRVPYNVFLEICDICHRENWFPLSYDAVGRPSSPCNIKILGVLRVLGRGVCFDDIEELSNISAEVHRKFFKLFLRQFNKFLYESYVNYPTLIEDIVLVVHVIRMQGIHLEWTVFSSY
mmetsp:Transcript_9125/g.8156  ORF Transcript_9125/g.8156 Transcript_9125/m.8156 type:complete len:199 (+) Transcript_9125:63-659(+)